MNWNRAPAAVVDGDGGVARGAVAGKGEKAVAEVRDVGVAVDSKKLVEPPLLTIVAVPALLLQQNDVLPSAVLLIRTLPERVAKL